MEITPEIKTNEKNSKRKWLLALIIGAVFAALLATLLFLGGDDGTEADFIYKISRHYD